MLKAQEALINTYKIRNKQQINVKKHCFKIKLKSKKRKKLKYKKVKKYKKKSEQKVLTMISM